MNTSAAALISMAVVLSYSFYRGWRWRNSNASLDAYFIMSKGLHASSLGTSFVATNVSVSTVLLALATVGYQYGLLGGLWLTLCWILGALLFVFLIQRSTIRQYLQTGHTLHEFIGLQYDRQGSPPYVRLAASAITLFIFWASVGVEFLAGVIVFSHFSLGVSPMMLALVIAVTVVAYTVIGGYRAATLLDYPQLILIVVGFVTLLGLTLWWDSANTATPSKMPPGVAGSPDAVWLIAIFVLMVPFQVSAMDMWQRSVAAAGDTSAIRRGVIGSLPIYAIWLVPVYLGTVARRAALPATNDVALVLFSRTLSAIPWDWIIPIVVAVVFGCLVATMASTGDTLLMSVTFTFMYDIYSWIKGIDCTAAEANREGRYLSLAKYYTGLFGLTSLLIVFVGLFLASMYELVATLFSVQIILFWPVIVAAYARRRRLNTAPVLAATGLVAGVIVALGFAATYMFFVKDALVLNSAPIAAFVVTGAIYIVLWLRGPKIQRGVTHGA
jgi:sodium/pantothenate symporter